MSINLSNIEWNGADAPGSPMGTSAGRAPQRDAGLAEFADVLSAEQNKFLTQQTTVRKGDTLTRLVKERYQAQGLTVNERQAYREALQVAAANGISNPDRINIGQKISLPAAPPVSSLQVLQQRTLSAEPTSQSVKESDSLVDKTLQRAVEKGFLANHQIGTAKEKILDMSNQFGFDADHFAMLTLMESNGMDPKADNGRCFGVIQFCEGPSSGAASVGMVGKAQKIKSMDLLSQLDLVRQYFSDLKLSAGNGPMSLDDLYLSVLHPAARSEKRRDVNLLIPGKQAKDLYAQTGQSAAITRNSIAQALIARAQQIFPDWTHGPNPSKQARLLSKIIGD